MLMVAGEHDEPYILGAADYMVEHVPSAHKIVFKDAADMVNMDHPEQFQSVGLLVFGRDFGIAVKASFLW